MNNKNKKVTPPKKKRRKKSSFRSKLLFLLIFLIIALVTSICVLDFTTPDTKSVQVHVKITDNGGIIMDYPITVTGIKPTASMAFEKGCIQKNVPYSLEDGMFDGFGGLFSTNTDGWLFYVNGSIADIGCEDYELKENDAIEFRYTNYGSEFSSIYSTPEEDEKAEIPVKVKIENENEVLLESTIMVNSDASTAGDALKNICDNNSVVYTITDGALTAFKNIVNSDEKIWKFYLNGNLLKDDINAKPVQDGDVLQFKYETVE